MPQENPNSDNKDVQVPPAEIIQLKPFENSGTASIADAITSLGAVFGNRFVLMDTKKGKPRAVGDTLEDIRNAITPSESETKRKTRAEQKFQDGRKINLLSARAKFNESIANIFEKAERLLARITKYIPHMPQPY